MKKIGSFLFTAVFAMLVLSVSVCAKSPVAQYFREDGKIKVSGSFEEFPKDDVINVLVLKNGADYTDFTQNDILYIQSARLDSDGKYEFIFDATEDYENAKIYIKSDNKYIPATAFKTVNAGDTEEIAEAEIKIDENVFVVGDEKSIIVKAFDSKGEKIEYDRCDFYGYDGDVVTVGNGSVRGLKSGDKALFAEVFKNGKSVKTEKIKLSVRPNAELPSIIGAVFKKGDTILPPTGDISGADKIVFSFDKDIPDIKGVRVVNITENAEKEIVGAYDAEQKTYTVSTEELGYSKYKFEIVSDELLGKSSVIEGCTADFGIPDVVAAGVEYEVDFSLMNCRGYAINYSNLEIAGATKITLAENETAEISATFYVNGEKREYKKQIRAAAVGDIILNVDKLRMEVGEKQRVSATVFATDGTILDVMPEFSASNSSRFSVDEKGVVTATSQGTGRIKAILGGITKSVVIFSGVDGNEDTQAGILIDLPTELESGEVREAVLSEISVLGVKTKIDGANFTSDNEEVIKIDNGKLRAVGLGSAIVSAEYGGSVYKKKITVTSNLRLNAVTELKSNVLAVGKTDVVKVSVNGNEYLSPTEFKLYTIDENVAEVQNNMIRAKKSGKTQIYARVKTENGYIDTDPFDITVFEPSGGYFTDDIDTTDKIYSLDSRLTLYDGELCTKGSSDSEAYVIYKLNGDIEGFTVYDHICNTSYERSDMYFYLSEDNETYEEVTDVKRYIGDRVNGWGTDAIVAENISGNYRYLKIVLDNGGNTQATRLSRVEIAYGTEPEVLDFKIIDDCNDDEIYKNILGRKAVVSFDQPINPDTLSNITVSGKMVSGEYDSELYRYEFKLPYKSTEKYSITVEGAEEASGKKNRVCTVEADALDGSYSAVNYAVYDENEASKRICIKNNTVQPKTYMVVECIYEDGKLTGVNTVKQGRIDSASEDYVYINRSGSKIFVWESFESMKPLM